LRRSGRLAGIFAGAAEAGGVLATAAGAGASVDAVAVGSVGLPQLAATKKPVRTGIISAVLKFVDLERIAGLCDGV
jgi:hypothetical protein